MRHIPSDKVQRYLGDETTYRISDAMRNWYGPKGIAVSCGHDGNRIYGMRGGDFVGTLNDGSFMSLYERQYDRTQQAIKRFWRRAGRVRHGRVNAGFADLGDLIFERTTNAKGREFLWLKIGTTGVVNATNSLWRVGSQPSAGAAAAAAPGGTVPTDATAGAFPFANPAGGDTQHFVSAWTMSSVAAMTCLMYDRIFAVAKTMNSTANEAVTGVPTRYQSTVQGDADSAESNFLFPECGTALPATAHNWVVGTAGPNGMVYTDQSGNANSFLPVITGNTSNIINRLDMPAGQWFAPLAAGDSGIQQLDNMQCSALVATGAIDFVIGHPLAWIANPIASLLALADGVGGAFNLERIFDDAAIAFLEVNKSATTATTYTGHFLTVAG